MFLSWTRYINHPYIFMHILKCYWMLMKFVEIRVARRVAGSCPRVARGGNSAGNSNKWPKACVYASELSCPRVARDRVARSCPRVARGPGPTISSLFLICFNKSTNM